MNKIYKFILDNYSLEDLKSAEEFGAFLRKTVEDIFEKENAKRERGKNMYNVIIFDSLNERKEYKCKRVYLRTDLSIMNLLTRNNEYITIDLKYVNYFEITTVEE